MSVSDKGKGPDSLPPDGKHRRRFLSPEKKYQIFLEAQRGEAPVGELLRREGARIQRKVKESALQARAVETCDMLHAFMSSEDGFTGGTRFEVEYAVSLGTPVLLHWENGPSKWIFQYSFPFWEGKQTVFLAWQDFFV